MTNTQTDKLTSTEASRLAEKGMSSNSGGGVPSLHILHTTEAEASKKRTEAEKLLADPDISDEDFNKLLQNTKG